MKIMTINCKSISNLNPDSSASYFLRQATLKDADEIHSIMDTCYQILEHKEYFICDDLDYVKDILSGNGFGVVACDQNGNIVGNLLVKYPGVNEENLGYDVFVAPRKDKNLTPKSTFLPTDKSAILLTPNNLNHVLHMDSASVLPKHRGHGLESKMIAYAETLVDTSKYCYSFATVAPENTASLKSLKRNGYQIMVTKEKYEGFLRCVMMKEIKRKVHK